jgi:hypothetical protein
MASFTCPAGAICSDQARTFVGATQQKVNTPGGKPAIRTVGGTPIFHRTTTTIKQDGAGNISGGETVVFIEKNGSWQPAAISKDGGKTYSFSDPKYPTMTGVAGAGLQKELQDANGAIHKNVDKNVSDALKKAGITKPEDKAKIIDATKGNGADGATDTGDTSQPVDLSTAVAGSDKTRNQFPELKYPVDIGETKQDVIKFTMLKYEPKKFGNLTESNLGGFSERDSNRKGIGYVVLPIPSGISDTNSVSWNGGDLDAAKAFAANVALTGITKGLGAAADKVGEGAQAISENSGEVATGLAGLFGAAAVGTDAGSLLSRTQGVVLNPNMELLFQGPTLRPFNFTFKMSARNSDEARQIISIIRFFKQGMSPQKSASNLFLKAPHTFRVQYLHLGTNGKVHPYIGKIKECALQSCTVNYTPEGQYATFRDGVLVSYEMTLQLQELEPVFNEDYGQGSGGNGTDLEIGY